MPARDPETGQYVSGGIRGGVFPASGADLDIENGMQCIEVAGRPEQTADSGRVEEQIVATEPRLVWGFGFTDAMNDNASNTGEVEITVTRVSTLDEAEISTEIDQGSAGWSVNEKITEYGFNYTTHDTAGSRDTFAQMSGFLQTFPVPFAWRENESWFVTFFASGQGGGQAGNYPTHECRIYYTSAEQQRVYQSRHSG